LTIGRPSLPHTPAQLLSGDSKMLLVNTHPNQSFESSV
jgi:hypothetical protein